MKPIAMIMATAIAVLIVGCNDDPAAPSVGTVTINPEPNTLNAPWQASGPAGYSQAGAGDMTLANMAAGNYTVTWGDVPGWLKPSPASVTQTLPANGSITFLGTYAPATGTVTVDAEPNNIDAPWTLTGPDGYSHAGTGDEALSDLAIGDYTLIWGALSSWLTPTPAAVTQTLAANGSLTFTGTYLARLGDIVIDVEPNATAAGWELAGPNGYFMTAAGDTTLDDLLIGSYTITWAEVGGYVAPAPETAELAEGQTLTLAGTYAPVGPPVVFPDTPDKLMANFQLIYEEMHFGEFFKVLHPLHVMFLQESTTNQFPDVGATLDLEEELRIAERMFSHLDVTDPEGSLVPGVQAIDFQTFQRQGSWTVSPANDLIPNTQFALYEAVILLDRGAGHTILKVQGAIKFYASSRDSVVDGVIRPYYRLRGQVDLTDSKAIPSVLAKATEVQSWGTVKAMFR